MKKKQVSWLQTKGKTIIQGLDAEKPERSINRSRKLRLNLKTISPIKLLIIYTSSGCAHRWGRRAHQIEQQGPRWIEVRTGEGRCAHQSEQKGSKHLRCAQVPWVCAHIQKVMTHMNWGAYRSLGCAHTMSQQGKTWFEVRTPPFLVRTRWETSSKWSPSFHSSFLSTFASFLKPE
jgi:hypothetical protein